MGYIFESRVFMKHRFIHATFKDKCSGMSLATFGSPNRKQSYVRCSRAY